MLITTSRTASLLLLASPLLLAACQPSDPQSTYSPRQVRDVLHDSAGNNQPTDRREDWSIALATFSAGDHRAGAQAMLEMLRREYGLTDLHVSSDESRSILFHGSYRSHDDRRLQSDLARIKGMVIEGGQPFATAFLVPPDTLEPGSDSPYSLSTVRRRHNPTTRLYTLEVGVYEDPDRQVAMRAAEEAVRVYREQGEAAFFYHGPHRSSVTIGVLTEAQVDFEAPGYGPIVRELRQRHPQRAVNGRTVRIREAGRDRGLAPSALMLIP